MTTLRELSEDEDGWWYAYNSNISYDGNGEVVREMEVRVYEPDHNNTATSKHHVYFPDPPDDEYEQRALAHRALLTIKLGLALARPRS